MLARQCIQFIRFSSIQRASCCNILYSKPFVLNDAILQGTHVRWLSTTSSGGDHPNDSRRDRFGKLTNFKISMTPEEKEQKQKEIAHQKAEEKPQGLFAKFKFYFKRYWYIALPVHMVSCSLWFGALFLVVRSGIDIIALLKVLHTPAFLIEKVQNVPEAAGELVVALILYKIISPVRYATTLAGIKLTFNILRRMGKLKSAKEVEYGVRTSYEKYERIARKLNERRLASVAARHPKTPAASSLRKKSHTKET